MFDKLLFTSLTVVYIKSYWPHNISIVIRPNLNAEHTKITYQDDRMINPEFLVLRHYS